MPELPVSVRVALWTTAALAAGGNPTGVWDRATPDLDAVGGEHRQLELWAELGEAALLVALPSSGRLLGLPRCAPDAVAAAVAAGEAVIAPGVGGLLVPTFSRWGPDDSVATSDGTDGRTNTFVGRSADQVWRVDWAAFDAEPVPIHRVAALDQREIRRNLTVAIADATTALEGLGGPVLGSRSQPPSTAHGRWAVPRGIPNDVLALLTQAAAVEQACAAGLLASNPELTVGAAEARERALRDLRAVAEQFLEESTNLAVAVLAGWRPA